MTDVLELLLISSLIILTLAILLCLVRVIKGPSIPDRIIALDNIGVNLIAVTAIVCILLRTTSFMGIILLLGILSFVGTTAFSKFIERGAVFEHKRNQ